MNTDSYRLAYRAGQEAARSDFEKSSGVLSSTGKALGNLTGKLDPRLALALGIGIPMGAAGAVLGGLGLPSAAGSLDKATLLGLGGASTAAAGIAGAANPGLARQTALLPRLSSEFAAASQTPGGMAKSLALMLGVPYGLYQLGKKVGENEASIF